MGHKRVKGVTADADDESDDYDDYENDYEEGW
jgi:hypothetical protein